MRLQRAQNYFNVYFRAKDYKLKGRSEQSMFLVYFLDPVFIDWHVWCFESQTIDPGQSKD